MNKAIQKVAAVVFAIVFVVVLLAALNVRNPTASQLSAFRLGLALTAALVAATVPSFFPIPVEFGNRATAAAAVCAAVYVLGALGLKSDSSTVADRGLARAEAREPKNGSVSTRVSPESFLAFGKGAFTAKMRTRSSRMETPSTLAARETPDAKFDAEWIWYDSENPAAAEPKGKVWFRREVRARRPSTGAVRLLCDEHCALWVNGRKIGEGTAGRLSHFQLSGIVTHGPNVLAVEAESRGGKAGLFIDGELQNEDGSFVSLDTGDAWLATRNAPSGNAWLEPGFDASSWKTARTLGPHAQSAWKSIALKETDLDRFDVPEGFEVTRLVEPKLVGSLIAMTWGNRGRLIASRENGPILSVIDDNGDGIYDRVEEYCGSVTNCQGLCTVGDDLYAVGNGPEGVGIYRLPDKNHDDKADDVQLVHHHTENMAEHGPHDVVFGPDGCLYYNLGNLGSISEMPESTTACRDYDEDHLLVPKFEDPAERFPGIKAPGGTIWRFTPDGSLWWCEASGFRNAYDFAFNAAGEMFTADSDTESEVGADFYRPVRVNHCTVGAEFGWRAGTANWPDHYFDSLPGTVEIGRGSPAGVVFYEHTQFPQRLQGAFLVCDWSMGRILAVHLERRGATYTGSFETILSGNPLNVCDIEVDRDGSLVFVTGGRNTEGGIYRLRYTAGSRRPADASNVAQLLALPQIEAAWAREIAARVKAATGQKWAPALAATAKSGTPDAQIRALTLLNQLGPPPDVGLLLDVSQSKDPAVRAFATHLLGLRSGQEVHARLSRLLADPDAAVRRRACEAFVQSGLEAPLDGLLAALGSDDRWERFAARLALERIPRDKWFDRAAHSPNLHVVFESLLASYRRDRGKSAETILTTVAPILCGPKQALSTDLKLNALRLVHLALLQGSRPPTTEQIARTLLDQFPTGETRIDAESADILAALNVGPAAEKLMRRVEQAPTHGAQLHFALALQYLRRGWNFDLKRRLMQWYEGTRGWEGGTSLTRYVSEIVGATSQRFTPDDRSYFVREWAKYPVSASLILRLSLPQQIAHFNDIAFELVDRCAKSTGHHEDELVAACIACDDRALFGSPRRVFRRAPAPSSLRRKIRRTLYERNPDLRELIARQIAANPTADDWPVLVRTLQFADETTLQLCLQGLGQLEQKPDDAETYRAVIQAGLKLGDRGMAAANLLKSWTGLDHNAGPDPVKAIAFYRKWYRQKFPAAPVPELRELASRQARYTFQQVMNALEQGAPGHAARGRQLFRKAQCAKCHRFGNEGEAVGPDLTSVRRRFQAKEIVESVLFPSSVISDRYRMVEVRTKQGGVYRGMPLSGALEKGKVVLLLSDATKLEIAEDQIEEQKPSNVSVMPSGLLDTLTLEQVADLFAFLETSKSNSPVASTPGQSASGAPAASGSRR